MIEFLIIEGLLDVIERALLSGLYVYELSLWIFGTMYSRCRVEEELAPLILEILPGLQYITS
jgi:hypothetical protein